MVHYNYEYRLYLVVFIAEFCNAEVLYKHGMLVYISMLL